MGIYFLQTLQIHSVDKVYVRLHVSVTMGALVQARLHVDKSVDIGKIDWVGSWGWFGKWKQFAAEVIA